jgi:hypothetical protein
VFVGRRYAGILGTIAFTTVVLQGLVRGGDMESTLRAAALSTLAYTGIGYVVGRLAAWIVHDSLRAEGVSEAACGPEMSQPPRSLAS